MLFGKDHVSSSLSDFSEQTQNAMYSLNLSKSDKSHPVLCQTALFHQVSIPWRFVTEDVTHSLLLSLYLKAVPSSTLKSSMQLLQVKAVITQNLNKSCGKRKAKVEIPDSNIVEFSAQLFHLILGLSLVEIH